MKQGERVGRQTIQKSVADGVIYLQAQQQKDGAFRGASGPSATPFKPVRTSPTIFFTSLIATCLKDIPRSMVIKRRAAAFLLSQRSPEWRWNYWIRGSRVTKTYPYPDDLDDIACAFSAIGVYKPSLVGGAALGHLAQTLIEAEIAPGGPYQTWLAGSSANGVAIDVAVNANIGFLLSKHDVSLPGLNSYIEQAVANNQFESDYYLDQPPVLYFVSRSGCCQGSHMAQLKLAIIDEIDSYSTHHNALQLSLLISSGCNAGVAHELLYPLIVQLLQLQKHGYWAAEALYKDPALAGVDQYAGSKALTTAFALEALQKYQKYSAGVKKVPSKSYDNHVKQAKSTKKQPQTSLLQKMYNTYEQHFLAHNDIPEITDIATITAAACGYAASKAVCDNLNAASLAGWIAYSIYDDFLDNEPRPELLGVANQAARNMQRAFRDAVPEAGFLELVSQTLDIVDEANTWEILHARAPQKTGKTVITKLPVYEDYSQLAHKSLGHMLASCGVLVAMGFEADSPEVTRFQEFFFYFLIARQLNDDAHDWELDLANGHLSPVICLLLADTQLPRKVTPAFTVRLRQKFWQVTIKEVHSLITEHVTAAQVALGACTFLHSTDTFNAWLTRLNAASNQALQKSQDAQKFIDVFRGSEPDKNL